MLRVLIKQGNPCHDERGRFCSTQTGKLPVESVAVGIKIRRENARNAIKESSKSSGVKALVDKLPDNAFDDKRVIQGLELMDKAGLTDKELWLTQKLKYRKVNSDLTSAGGSAHYSLADNEIVMGKQATAQALIHEMGHYLDFQGGSFFNDTRNADFNSELKSARRGVMERSGFPLPKETVESMINEVGLNSKFSSNMVGRGEEPLKMFGNPGKGASTLYQLQNRAEWFAESFYHITMSRVIGNREKISEYPKTTKIIEEAFFSG